MLQFDQPPFQTTDPPMPQPVSPQQAATAGLCALGPSPQGVAVALAIWNALVDLQLFYRDPTSPGYSVRPGPLMKGVGPLVQTFPGAVGFVIVSHVAGSPAQVIGQVWETTDGPVPALSLPTSGTLGPGGGFTPFSLDVTDGVTSVNASEIDFTSGATVTNLGSGIAGVAVTGGGGGGTVQATVPLDTPDASGNGYPTTSQDAVYGVNFANVRRIIPMFSKSVDGYWAGTIRVPQNYVANPKIIISAVANATTGTVRWVVATAVVAAGVSEDTAYTSEAAVNQAVPATAGQRFDSTIALSTTPAAGSSLNVRITRNGSNVADTLAVPCGLWECVFQYLS